MYNIVNEIKNCILPYKFDILTVEQSKRFITKYYLEILQKIYNTRFLLVKHLLNSFFLIKNKI